MIRENPNDRPTVEEAYIFWRSKIRAMLSEPELSMSLWTPEASSALVRQFQDTAYRVRDRWRRSWSYPQPLSLGD